MSGVDLHMHSTASDGRYSPAELVSRGVAAKLAVMALTDHDTVDGFPAAQQAARGFPRLTVVPGVEISTDVPQGEVHLLGYYIDHDNGELQQKLVEMRASRLERAQGMLTKLKELGMPLEWERVRQIAGSGAVGRPHVAQAMLEKGYISSIREAFTKYLGWGGPAYVERKKLTPEEAVELVLRASGIPVLAHPYTVPGMEDLVASLCKKGLAGLEVYYAGYSTEQINGLLALADRYGLITTGGSDFHGLEASETALGGVDVPLQCAEHLAALARKKSPGMINR